MSKVRRSGRPERSWPRIVLWVVGALVVVFLLIQFIPYGRSSHANPPATNAFQWSAPGAEAIARASCYDCHSNETTWWWATDVAPFSWLVQHDVDDGRARLNFSEFDGLPPADQFQRVVNGGEMPPLQYTLIHPGAKLNDAQRRALIAGYTDGLVASSASGSGDPGAQSTPTPSPTSTTTAAAESIINQRCSQCHPPDPALQFHAGSTAEAQALIDSMVQRGAQLSTSEQQALLAYYTR